MLRPRVQMAQDSRDQDPRVVRFADHIVEPRYDRVAPFPRGWWHSRDTNEDSKTESGLSPHSCCEYGNHVYCPQHDNHNLVLSHHHIGRPLSRLDNSKAPALKRLIVRDFPSGAVDDQYRALLHVAISQDHGELNWQRPCHSTCEYRSGSKPNAVGSRGTFSY
jgi:hypothetical protein